MFGYLTDNLTVLVYLEIDFSAPLRKGARELAYRPLDLVDRVPCAVSDVVARPRTAAQEVVETPVGLGHAAPHVPRGGIVDLHLLLAQGTTQAAAVATLKAFEQISAPVRPPHDEARLAAWEVTAYSPRPSGAAAVSTAKVGIFFADIKMQPGHSRDCVSVCNLTTAYGFKIVSVLFAHDHLLIGQRR